MRSTLKESLSQGVLGKIEVYEDGRLLYVCMTDFNP